MQPDRTPTLLLEELVVRDLRNVEHAEMALAPRLNVISGGNGQGKTSLLEAIYLAATSRSFRTTNLAELVRHGASTTSVKGRFSERGGMAIACEQSAVIEGRRTFVRVDGNRPASLGEFATRSPVLVFHPDELALTRGPSTRRRTLLDRVSLFMNPASADHRVRYGKALRARQELLRRGSFDSAELDAFEQLCASEGARLTRARRLATEAVIAELLPAFASIAAPGIALAAAFSPGGSEDPVEAQEALSRHRRADARRKSATFGPHRDELSLSLDGHPARVVGSQGQHRALTLSLKAAEAACVAEARGVVPLLLLDDVSSELDRERTEALFAFLGFGRGQIVLTTTRPELIEAKTLDGGSRRHFVVERGVVRPVD